MIDVKVSSSTLRCPICGCTEIVRNDVGDFVCARCGTVVQEAREIELDAFEGYDSNNAPLQSRGSLLSGLHDGGLGSQMDLENFRGRRRWGKLARMDARNHFRNDKDSFTGDVIAGIKEYRDKIISVTEVPIPHHIVDDANRLAKMLYDRLPRRMRTQSIAKRRLIGLALLLVTLKAYGTYLPPEIVLRELDLSEDEIEYVKRMMGVIHSTALKEELRQIETKRSTNEKIRDMLDILLKFLRKKTDVEPARETLVLELAYKIAKLLAKSGGGKYSSSIVGAALYIAMRALAHKPKACLTQEALAEALDRGANAVRQSYVQAVNTQLIIIEVPALRSKERKCRRTGRKVGGGKGH